MSNQNESPGGDNFSEDPEEKLRMQNDFLKMKMMAESGAIHTHVKNAIRTFWLNI